MLLYKSYLKTLITARVSNSDFCTVSLTLTLHALFTTYHWRYLFMGNIDFGQLRQKTILGMTSVYEDTQNLVPGDIPIMYALIINQA